MAGSEGFGGCSGGESRGDGMMPLGHARVEMGHVSHWQHHACLKICAPMMETIGRLLCDHVSNHQVDDILKKKKY